MGNNALTIAPTSGETEFNPQIDEIIEEAKKEFANLPEGPLNLAIAKKDQREKSLCLLSLMK